MQAVCSINNRSRIVIVEGKYKIQGEPTEAALKVFAEKFDYNCNSSADKFKTTATPFSDQISQTITKVATLDFSSERKCMSTIITGYKKSSTNVVLLKGAPERVIEKCNTITTKSNAKIPLSAAQKTQLIDKIKKVASKGLRVLAVAIAEDGGQMKHITSKNASDELSNTDKYAKLESDCSFVGYVCIKDPVRPEVKASIQDCRTAGINVIMITGDSKETAIAIA